MMRKILPVLGMTCALACSSAALAQRYGNDSPRSRVTANQIVDQFDAETARLKASLRLTPDQEKNWGNFQAALHDMATARANAQFADRRDVAVNPDPRDTAPVDPANRDAPVANGDRATTPASQDANRDDGAMAAMRAKADTYADMSTNLKKLADALQPLYGTLDNKQRSEVIRFVRKDFSEMYDMEPEGRGRR